MFAALTTIEPPIVERSMAFLMEQDQPWYAARLPMLDDPRPGAPVDPWPRRWAPRTGWTAAFGAGDLLMVTVLRRLATSGLLAEFPALAAYVARGEDRPAYRRAFADQLAVFTASAG